MDIKRIRHGFKHDQNSVATQSAGSFAPGSGSSKPSSSSAQGRACNQPEKSPAFCHDWIHDRDPRPRGCGPSAWLLELACCDQPAGSVLGYSLPGRHPRLSPPADAPVLPPTPLAGTIFCHLRRPELPTRSNRLGGATPASPQVFRYGCRSSQQPSRLLVEPHGLDVPPDRGHACSASPHRRSRE